MFRRAKILCALAATTVVLATIQPAAAALDVLGAMTGGTINNFQDNSADFLINGANGTLTGGTNATQIQVGSILLSEIALSTVQPGAGTKTAIGTGSAYTQLNALVALEIASISFSGSGASTIATLVMKPATSSTDITAITGVSAAAGAAVGSWAKGTLLAAYDVSQATPFSRNGATMNADVLTTVGGTQLWQFGFTGSGGTNAATGEGWSASALATQLNVGTFAFIPYPTQAGNVNFSLDQSAVTPYSNLLGKGVLSGVDLTTDVALNGSSNLLGIQGAGSTTWQAFDNANISLDVNIIPEPASLSVWFGACLIGGLLLRRRLRRS